MAGRIFFQSDRDGNPHVYSMNPDGSRLVDVRGHKAVWVSSLGGEAKKVFEFSDADVRIDYPVWGPDGRSLLFDCFKPKEGDLWLAEGVAAR